MSYIDDVLKIAEAEIGIHEQGGNNRGPRVEEYQKLAGIGPGDPWCAAFVSWALAQAKVPEAFCTGDTWGIRTWGKDHGVYVAVPRMGSVFLLLDYNDNPKHTGFVRSVVNKSTFTTIEGNVDGSDGVGGVHSLTRDASTCRFVDWYPVALGARRATVEAPSAMYKVFWHDGKGSVITPGGVTTPIRGVKVNGEPWAGGEMIIGL